MFWRHSSHAKHKMASSSSITLKADGFSARRMVSIALVTVAAAIVISLLVLPHVLPVDGIEIGPDLERFVGMMGN